MSNGHVVQIDDVRIHTLPVLESNYVYIIEWDEGALVLDPAEAEPVMQYMGCLERERTLSGILNTHAHYDHVAGNLALKKWSGAAIYGPMSDRIPGLDHGLHSGDEIVLGPITFRILETPGHTRNDICFYDEVRGVLFAGDTLFAAGCGRLFEGTPDQMWESLCRLRALPDETRVFFGHEYTEGNLLFAKHMLPDHDVIAQRLEVVREVRSKGGVTVPTTIHDEKETNIFLMCDDDDVLQALGMQGFRPEVAFGEVRTRKNSF